MEGNIQLKRGCMKMVAASIGFSGTHSISAILSGMPDTYVAHGTQNIKERTPIGVHDQAPEDFLDDMCALDEQFSRVIAVPPLFSPRPFKTLCDKKGIEYNLIVREPSKQVKSCYYWLVQKFHEGDKSLSKLILTANERFKRLIAPTLANGLYIHA